MSTEQTRYYCHTLARLMMLAARPSLRSRRNVRA